MATEHDLMGGIVYAFRNDPAAREERIGWKLAGIEPEWWTRPRLLGQRIVGSALPEPTELPKAEPHKNSSAKKRDGKE
jgi:hypothetical protein